MEFSQTWLAVLAFFIVIGPLIFFHELGHFLAAKWNKIVVEEFGIGLPPRLLTLFEWGGTKFTFNALPLGGFVRPSGEDDPSVPGGMAGSSKFARISVLAAGPLANIAVAFVIMTIMFMTGAPEGAIIAKIEPGSPAAAAGLQVGDVVLSLDDMVVHSTRDLLPYILAHIDQPIVFTIKRGDSVQNLSVTPRSDPPANQGPTGIIIESLNEVKKYDFFGAIGRTLEELAWISRQIVELPGRMLRGQVAPNEMRPISVVGISQIGGQAIGNSIELNAIWPIAQLTAGISIALALTNLLPIPALDGGRILFVILEAIRGRRVDPQRETAMHFVGFALLLTAMLIFVYLDIVNPIIPMP